MKRITMSFKKNGVKKLKPALITQMLIASMLLHSSLTFAKDLTQLTVEENRIADAQKTMPDVFVHLDGRYQQFQQQIALVSSYTALTQLVIRHANGLWQDAVTDFSTQTQMDDRPLYWTRLQMQATLRQAKVFKALLPMQQEKILSSFELLSRGQQDIKFDQGADKKILVTGFDPFFLDKNINQSNPSGIAALALDDILLSADGIKAEVETLIFPVRFADFDQGIVETLLAPYMKNVDMIVTVSMGRTEFDLERFPARRRSAKAPDNLNVLTGGSAKNPIIPLLNQTLLKGAEFVEFSLPVEAMKKAQGQYNINDNRKVSTLTGKFSASSLQALQNETSVEGSGGGYLSNEISYRSLLLRNNYSPLLPVGHIHTPRIKAYEPKTSEKIITQIKQMLTLAIPEI